MRFSLKESIVRLCFGATSEPGSPRYGRSPHTSSAGLLTERIETRFLLVRERAVELLERRLNGLCGLDHGVKPLLDRIEPAHRRLRDAVRTGRLQDRNGLLVRFAQPVEAGSL